MHQLRFDVRGMTCRHCVAAVTRAIRTLDPDAAVRVELASGRVDVDSTGLDPDRALAALRAEGYQARLLEPPPSP